MLDETELAHLEKRLRDELATLERDADYRRQSTGAVELDQTRTGRLSRMDALQGQAMAKATAARAGRRVLLIRAALRRLDEGRYGDCVRCEEPITPGRLRSDAATALCIDCAARAERS